MTNSDNPQPIDMQNEIRELRAAFASLRQEISQTDSEVDALQIQTAMSHRPWYRQASVIISLTAVLFSLGTTAVSAYRTAQQDVYSSRGELRGLLQRLAALPKEYVEAQAYGNLGQALSRAIGAEHSLLATQAVDVINRIPEHVSAVECTLVATALMESNDWFKAEPLLLRAIEKADNANDKVAALRTYGILKFQFGDLNSGRENFNRALASLGEYSLPAASADWLAFNTETSWAQAELGHRQCEEATQHLKKAQEILNKYPRSLSMMPLQMQIVEMQHENDRACPSGKRNRAKKELKPR